ncbi:MAG: hypothetical protein HKN91_13895 [Acidimicrobiia bacterium]|nr:hypothetical protein [Acidimicrobiia bacterium]
MPSAPANSWTQVATVDLEAINSGLDPAIPTADVALYYPNNLDPAHSAKVTPDLLVSGFVAAKDIFGVAGVQLKLLFFKTGPLDPSLFEVNSTRGDGDVPSARFTNMYAGAERRPAKISMEAQAAFETMVEDRPGSELIVHIVTLQDVYMEFFEKLDYRTWQRKTISTGGLSFPGYMYGETMPRHLRGVISITDLTKSEDSWKTIAHELGHKLLNVSHEYRDVSPQHEVNADGGLMLYGKGTEILPGADGRYHRERLHRSPYLYTEDTSGERTYNPDYQAGGFYFDPIYEGVSVDLDAEALAATAE